MGRGFIASGERYHSSVIEELRGLRAQPKRLFNCRLRLREFARLERSPCHGVCTIDISPHCILFRGHLVSLFGFHIMVGIKERKVAIVEDAIQLAETAYMLD